MFALFYDISKIFFICIYCDQRAATQMTCTPNEGTEPKTDRNNTYYLKKCLWSASEVTRWWLSRFSLFVAKLCLCQSFAIFIRSARIKTKRLLWHSRIKWKRATAADCQLHFHVLPHVKSKILSGEILLSLREIHCLSMSKYTNVHIYTKIFKTFGTCLA